VGGAYSSFDSHLGTVFSVTLGGKENVLHSFGSGSDGLSPTTPLVDVSGTLYGTTREGGAYGGLGRDGTVFSITTSGVEKVLHSFGSGTDGLNPEAGLTDINGTLYGTTQNGGANTCPVNGAKPGCGTVFSITPDGTERVLYSFNGKGTDGYFPEAGLTEVNGTLYGTTFSGGAYNRTKCSVHLSTCIEDPPQGGVVFSITTDGKEKVLHRCGKGDDVLAPSAGLVDVKGTLYGTTPFGGAAHARGYGTVFSITTDGREKVLHRFGAEQDGGHTPRASLIDVHGVLYGTTFSGGAYSNNGTLFSITTGGKETVLHSFGKGTDGSSPAAGLLDVDGTLYGTTLYGGKYYGSAGFGTVFALTP
jgi:uncharacterized repeat protein (TIGR03803 family)